MLSYLHRPTRLEVYSNKMELEGAKRSFNAIKVTEKLPIKTFVSDRHRGIGKWMETSQQDTTHYYDIWHQAKSTVNKVLKASKEKGCEILKKWSISIRNHIYWCAASSKAGWGANERASKKHVSIKYGWSTTKCLVIKENIHMHV